MGEIPRQRKLHRLRRCSGLETHGHDLAVGLQRKRERVAAVRELRRDDTARAEIRIERTIEVVAHALDYPCTTGLPKDVIARNTGALRNDSELVTMARLRMADVATNLSNFTVFSEEIRDGLHSVAQQNP